MAEEIGQRAGALGKLKAHHALVRHFVGAPAHHVADVDFGDFIVGEIGIGQAGGAQLGADFGQILRAGGLDAHENMRHFVVAVAVVEFGDVAAAQHVDKFQKAAGFFGNRHGENAFVTFAQFAALGNVAQAVEIHVGAAGNGNQGLALRPIAGDIGFEAGQRQCAGGLGDAAGVVVDIFDGAANGIGVDGDDVVEQVAADAEGFFAHEFHGGAV